MARRSKIQKCLRNDGRTNWVWTCGVQACERLGLGITHQQVLDIIIVDSDNNGTIDYSEFIEILNSVYDKMHQKEQKEQEQERKQKEAPYSDINCSVTACIWQNNISGSSIRCQQC